MHVQEDNQPYDEINVTPMLDLAYVLLVIFIIMTTASVQGVKVELPKTAVSSSLAKPGTKAVTVARNGDVFLDAYPVTMEQLDLRLAQYLAANPALSIVIKGDGQAQYAKVMEVMELLKRNGITDLGLATTRAQR
ncbi:ExbD/TolR family protein [Ferribacterium limneticum]|uniref:ExbD/TolR family protein n=1 Tax=Ferribacterium limneticum TaxID=76259 RepID=UPI001CFBFEC6|nr:biopolymer transporter ExbD [Ferribacterium limneticum]UCV30011.1 biopolymer transporter ExbD [Ferribacterium limneticum]UCV33930.1 biopolymer transporter ExbD [Ferribacterium limneticum]